MSEFSIYLNSINTFSAFESSNNLPTENNSTGPSVWNKSNSIIKDPIDESKKEKEAQKAGYKTTSDPDTFYDKEKKLFYRWNTKDSKFEVLENAKKVYENGSYLTNDKKIVLKSGSVYDKAQKKYTDADRKEISKSQFEAEKRGFEKTPNKNIFFDKKNNQFYIWDTSVPFNNLQLMPDIEKMLPTGAYIRKSGRIVDTEFNSCMIGENGKKVYQKVYGRPMENENEIINFEIRVNGYAKTNKENCYFDSENKTYLKWDKESQSFVKSDIEELTTEGFYKKEGKYYNSEDKETTLKEFIKNKKNLVNTKSDGILLNEQTKTLYKWNASKADFEVYDPDANMKKFLASVPDGEVDNFAQGKKGDCWLLSAIKSLEINDDGKKLLKASLLPDGNGNIKVLLKGVNKSYTFSKDELNKAAKTQEYSSGDKDVLAIELAFEKYRMELIDKKQANRDRSSLRYMGAYYENDYLYNGSPENAIKVLTGKEVKTFMNTNQKKYTNEELKPYFDNKKNAITVILNNSDKMREDVSHAFAFVNYDENNFYLIDSYDTSEVKTFTKDEFYKKFEGMSLLQPDKSVDLKRRY